MHYCEFFGHFQNGRDLPTFWNSLNFGIFFNFFDYFEAALKIINFVIKPTLKDLSFPKNGLKKSFSKLELSWTIVSFLGTFKTVGIYPRFEIA